jgi:hypothetical protein
MSTTVYRENQRWEEFSFFTSGGTDGVITDTIALDRPFIITDVRAHCSVAFASVEDLVVRMSAYQGSAYNVTLVSQAMNTVQDVFYQPSISLTFLSDDHVIIGLSLASGTNIIGINVNGWAAIN